MYPALEELFEHREDVQRQMEFARKLHTCISLAMLGVIMYLILMILIQSSTRITVMEPIQPSSQPIYTGKVRNIYAADDDTLFMEHSDRLSCFNKHVCDVPYKGEMLTIMSRYWFSATGHIIPNHFKWSVKNVMCCKKCTPIKVEVVVRDYITGSLWRAYAAGERTFCGVTFPDGLTEHQKLPKTVITPTLKNATDDPTTATEIVEQGLCTEEQWNYIQEKASELFAYGRDVAADKGYILVDTKYEFGLSPEGEVLLIDELHTCDSSRYWKQGSTTGLDKDVVRHYIAELMRKKEYTKDTVTTPEFKALVRRTTATYYKFCKLFTGYYNPELEDLLTK